MTGGEVFLFFACLVAIYRVIVERSRGKAILAAYKKLSDNHKELLETAIAVEAHNVFLQIEMEQIKRERKRT